MGSTPMPMVQMFAPDGTLGDIPYDRMHDAVAAGGKIASKITAPDGTPGYVPAERRAEALQAGAKPVPLDSGEDAQESDYGFNIKNVLNQGFQGAKNVGSGLYNAGKDVLFPQGNNEGQRLKYLGSKYLMQPSADEWTKAKNAPTTSEAVGHGLAAALPVFGPWAAGLGEQAGSGDVGGALARGGTEALAAKTVSTIGETVAGGRAGLSRMARDPRTGAVRNPYETAVDKLLPDPDAVDRAHALANETNTRLNTRAAAKTAKDAAAADAEARQAVPLSQSPYANQPPPFMSKLPARLPPNLRGDPFNPPVEPQPETALRGDGSPTTTGGAQQPFEPTIYSSEQEYDQLQRQKANLKRQASAAGTYHAAQGAVGKKTNLQQRIGRKFPWDQNQ